MRAAYAEAAAVKAVSGEELMTPAQQLEGLTLGGGWVVGSLIPRPVGHTGGHFSCAYGVTNPDGRTGFLKAMDYSSALSSADPAVALNVLTSAFLFERDVLQECVDRRMSKIVRAIDGGKVSASGSIVEYLIFEPASGDIRHHLDSLASFDLTWTITCMHNICVGIRQLNGASIAHQDLKPSNVLEFAEEGQKLADLGRAWHRSRVSPHDSLECAGDMGYAPPELLYHYTAPDESDRRFGADFYLVGSMVLFLFTGTRATQLLFSELDPQFHPANWPGSYAEVLPYLQHAFATNMTTVRNMFFDATLGEEVVDVYRQMCDPNIATRGDRLHLSKIGSRFGLERFISRFDRLRTQALLGRIRHP
jgi:eukaryotic-like serine/threonine-protein kinase